MSQTWDVQDSARLYHVAGWSDGYVGISDGGHAVIETPDGSLDLASLADDCVRRGIQLPLLVRLPGVIEHRIEVLASAFATARAATGFRGDFRGVYPIKVNQERHIVEDLLAASRRHRMGIECGSKPELLVALALHDDPEALVVVNGFKDKELIALAVGARELGRRTVVVVEQPDELGMILDAASFMDVAPGIGMRVKLGSSGSGKWSGSSGDRAKFGLTPAQLLSAVDHLRAADALPYLELLHFHIGSQVTDIRAIRQAVQEATRFYCELHRLGARPRFLDIGGGLGVDYDGSRTNFECSANYDVHEYAMVVTQTIQAGCDAAGVPHPHVVTECGRWMVAHSTLLVTSVLGRSYVDTDPREALGVDAPSVEGMRRLLDGDGDARPQTTFHAASAIRRDVLTRFLVGAAELPERAAVDVLYRAICRRLLERQDGEPLHEELAHLPIELADIYFCNFSVFQSVPDSWAIDQLFPIMPLTRLDEEPQRDAILADLTCDSDGKIDRFIDQEDVRPTLRLHEPDERAYYLGFFLLGAYQETLGDLHNLFGDTHAVHVRAASDKPAGYIIEAVVEGETTEEVLSYLQYDKRELVRRVRAAIEAGCADGALEIERGQQFMERYLSQLRAYTYLESPRSPTVAGRGDTPPSPRLAASSRFSGPMLTSRAANRR